VVTRRTLSVAALTRRPRCPKIAGVLALLGATGYTGGLALELARTAGFPVRLVGRRVGALAAIARDREEVRVADARDSAALREAFEGARVVVSTAGPFLELGEAPIRAAIAAGAHYVDSSAEQAFTRLVYDTHGEAAREHGVTLLPSFGFDFVPGDLAAHIAAEGVEPADEIVVAYSVRRFRPSAGSRRTLGRVLQQEQVAFENGVHVVSSFGATTRRVRFPDGEHTVVEWGGTEPLTVPRHTHVRNVRSYLRAPKAAARSAALGRLLAPVVRASGAIGRGPGNAGRSKARWAVVAEARGTSRRRRVTLVGNDVYGLTARLLVTAAEALLAGEIAEAGALAAAQAFDARALVSRLEPLVRLSGEEES
jgi:short subunit dehydrogenase-like uncharacterized protein